jgi:hypothetical protein
VTSVALLRRLSSAPARCVSGCDIIPPVERLARAGSRAVGGGVKRLVWTLAGLGLLSACASSTTRIAIQSRDLIYVNGRPKFEVFPGDELEVLYSQPCRGSAAETCWAVRNVKTGATGFTSKKHATMMHRVYAVPKGASRVPSSPGVGGSPAKPTGPFSVSPSGTGIRGVTVFTFSAAASDAASPSYVWDFGDGTGGSGRAVTHVFANEGTFQVSLRVDGSGAEASGSASVAVGSLAGTWAGSPAAGVWSELVVTQEGGTLTGRWTVHVDPGSPWYKPGGPNLDVSQLSGTVSDPRNVTVSQGGECLRTFRNGTVNESLTLMAGGERAFGNPSCGPTTWFPAWHLRRQ